jgi:hypothetical protein
MQIYKTVLRPVTTYGSETWTLTKSDENSLRIFERKILRKIYGPVQEGDTCRIRYNEELKRFIKGEDIVKFIKAQRIRWLGHVKTMEAGAMPRRMMEGRYTSRSKRNENTTVDGEGSGDWLSRRPRLTQGCSAEWMDVFLLLCIVLCIVCV